jgi:putative two-component system response regulator
MESGAERARAELRPEASEAQLQLYARDFRKLLNAERAKSKQLEATNRQLERYAYDLHSAFLREQARARELEKSHHGTLLRLLRAARFKDDETASHLRRIRYFCRAMAIHLGWSAEQAQQLMEASPMHDIGKIGVPDAILHKAGPLTAEEWRIMKRHPSYGGLLLEGSGSPLLELAREIALCHHERWDGSGYPRGLKCEAIPAAARVLTLADNYDALRSRRAYKPAFSHERACDIMLNGDGRTAPEHFDPQVLEAFADLKGAFEEIHASHYP